MSYPPQQPPQQNPQQNPYQAPDAPGGAPPPGYGYPPQDPDFTGKPPMPGTVIGVIVLISIIGLLMLFNILTNPIVGVLTTGITVAVLVGVIKGKSWARSMSLFLSGAAIILMLLSLLMLFSASALSQAAIPAEVLMAGVGIQVALNVTILVLLNTESAKSYFVF